MAHPDDLRALVGEANSECLVTLKRCLASPRCLSGLLMREDL
jgi:hypothetical protein